MVGPDIRITQQVEDARWVDGKVQPQIRVEFYVGDHGPFTLRIPKDSFLAGDRDRLVEDYARVVRVT